MYAIDRAGPDQAAAPDHVRPTRTDPMSTATRPPATPRQVADRYVDAVCDLDPIVATMLGNRPGDDRLPDPSPAGLEAEAELARAHARRARPRARGRPGARTTTRSSARCARLLRERLGAELAAHEAGEELPGAVQPVQPGALHPPGLLADAGRRPRRTGRSSPAGWPGCRRPTAATARRWRRAPGAGCSSRRGRSTTVVGQLGEWLAGPVLRRLRRGRARTSLRGELDAAARAADEAVAEIRDFLRDTLRARGPRARRTPSAGSATPSPPAGGPAPTSAPATGWRRPTRWGWAEHQRILAEQRIEAEKVLAGAHPDGGHALAGRARRGRRRRRGGPRAAAGDDGRGDRRPRRHALRPRRAGPPGRGDDRAAGQRRRAVLHPPVAGLLPPGPHLAADAGPRPLPDVGPGLDLVPRGRSRPPPAAGAVGLRLRASCRPTRPRSARSAPTSRAGRSTPSG